MRTLLVLYRAFKARDWTTFVETLLALWRKKQDRAKKANIETGERIAEARGKKHVDEVIRNLDAVDRRRLPKPRD